MTVSGTTALLLVLLFVLVLALFAFIRKRGT